MLEKLSVWHKPWARGEIYINVAGSFETEKTVGKERGLVMEGQGPFEALKPDGLGFGVSSGKLSLRFPSTHPIRIEY